MDQSAFTQELDQRIAKFDLLCHPFYKAWSSGELTREDLREYASDYYHHVEAFPQYLAEARKTIADQAVRSVLLDHQNDEEGLSSASGRSHAEIWLDFARGMGANRQYVLNARPPREISTLIETFNDVSKNGTPAMKFASFYAYESQVPRIAKEKENGLKAHYNADDAACYYFSIHKTADVHHAESWLDLLWQCVRESAAEQKRALDAAEHAAKSLWTALDGIENARQLRKRAS
jgi:pyrroloquinoline-quinone synthase